MAGGEHPIPKLVKTQDDEARRRGAVLAGLYKAMKAVSFYPKGHPLRAENLQHAHNSMVNLLNATVLPLVIKRNGFSSQDGGAAVDNNPMALALAGELYIRRVTRITFLEDLSPEDLRSFLFLLTMDPQKLADGGGIEKVMAERGIKTIWANEVDLSAIWEKRLAMEAADTLVTSDEEEEAAPVAVAEEAELAVDELIALMDEERDDDRYLRLARILAAKSEGIKAQADFASLLPVMDALAAQSADESRSAVQREYAVFTLEQVTGGNMTDFLLQQMENKQSGEHERIYRICRQLGVKMVYVIIQRLCIADGLFARKALAKSLVRIGPPAVPFLASMLRDGRWYVARNMVAILGEIGCRDCLNELKPSLYHSDQRVRREAVRAIAKIGGSEAESIFIGLLADRDPATKTQAIHWLGIMKSRSALQPLLEIIAERDIFLKSLPLKKEALQAIGRIGDRRATPHLLGLLGTRHWAAWNRWEELKISAAEALGQLGDKTALHALKARGTRGGRLGAACAEAIDNLERVAKETRE